MRGGDCSGLAERSPFLEQSIDLAGEQWEAAQALIPCLLTEWGWPRQALTGTGDVLNGILQVLCILGA